jgi:hypothetical protein
MKPNSLTDGACLPPLSISRRVARLKACRGELVLLLSEHEETIYSVVENLQDLISDLETAIKMGAGS